MGKELETLDYITIYSQLIRIEKKLCSLWRPFLGPKFKSRDLGWMRLFRVGKLTLVSV